MRCPIASHDGREALLALSSRRRNGDRAAALEAHVRECASCAAFVADQRAVSDALDLWEAPPVAGDFDRRLYERISREAPWWSFLTRPFGPLFGARWVPVAAAAGLMIAAGLWIERPGAAPAVSARAAEVEALPPDQAAVALEEMQVMQEFSNLIHADAEPQM